MILLDEQHSQSYPDIICIKCLEKETKLAHYADLLQVEVMKADLAQRERDSWKRAYKALAGETE